LAAAQGFFRSLPSAIFLFSSITGSQANILPVIVTNHTVTIAAELVNGGKLVGQCEISHPVQPPDISINVEPMSPLDGMGTASCQQQNALFEQQSKDDWDALPSPISRIYYMNAYGHEVYPSPNPDYLASISSSDVLVYSCGSLWTSIMPCLALRGVAQAIARSSLRIKVLLLNSINDRETDGYTAIDYIHAIAGSLNSHYAIRHYGLGGASTTYPISAFVTHLVYVKESHVLVDEEEITRLGVKCVQAETCSEGITSIPKFDADCIRKVIRKILSEQ